jgi:ABC-type phosphate transport system substrate-binding protein
MRYAVTMACVIVMALMMTRGVSSAESIAVIVNPANPVNSLAMEDVKKYYSDIISMWPNREHISIVDLPMEDATRQIFSRRVLEKNPEDVMMEWASKRITNTANNPPMIIKSPVLVQAWVATQKWAIGYMPASMVDPTKVKVALTIR